MTRPGFWDDQNGAREVIAEANELKSWVEPYDALRRKVAELAELGELLELEPDEALAAEWQAEVARLDDDIERLELRAMLRGPDDMRDAMVTIHPGAGGTESQDWAEMLMRMYTRWAERNGFKVAMLDLQPGEEAGIKSVTLEIAGQYAYGYLKAEKGVHRLVRISPFDAQSRRHTSFASVFVYPASTCTAPRARAASTSTRRAPRYASRTCRPASSWRVRTSAASSRTRRPR